MQVLVNEDVLYLKDSIGKYPLIYLGNKTFTLENDPVHFKYISKNRIQVIEELWDDEYAYRKK
ncbi:hypothetical protein GCM10025777_22670 [Membranihabitans marinus]